METNSHFLKLSWEVPLMLEIVSLGFLPGTSTVLVNGIRLCQPKRVRNLSAGVVKVPPSPIKAALTAKASGLHRK